MPSKLPAILVGGVSMGLLIVFVRFIPLLGECLACLAIAAAGVIAVWKYTNDHRLTVSGGQGAGMGAMAAIVAGITDALVGLVLNMMGLAVGLGAMRDQAIEALEQGGYDPEAIDMMEEIFQADWFIPAVLACSLLLYIFIGAIGGAIGAASFKKGGDEGEATSPKPGQPRV